MWHMRTLSHPSRENGHPLMHALLRAREQQRRGALRFYAYRISARARSLAMCCLHSIIDLTHAYIKLVVSEYYQCAAHGFCRTKVSRQATGIQEAAQADVWCPEQWLFSSLK